MEQSEITEKFLSDKAKIMQEKHEMEKQHNIALKEKNQGLLQKLNALNLEVALA